MAKSMTAADIEKFREAMGWTQAELAERLGVSQVSVSRWETGERVPRRPVLLLLESIRDRITNAAENLQRAS